MRTVVALVLAAVVMAGCDTGVSANVGACSAAAQTAAATIALIGAAATGDSDSTDRQLARVVDEAERLANESSGPLGQAASDLHDVALSVQESGGITSDEAKQALSDAADSLLDLCR